MNAEIHSLRIDPTMKAPPVAPRRWPLILLLLFVVLLLGAAGGVYLRKMSAPPPPPPAPVADAPAAAAPKTGPDAVVLQATGYIVAAHKIELAPKVVGRVAWIGVEMGDHVQEGQPLVRLEDDEYKARVLQAQGQLDAAQARYDELKNGSRPEDIARAKADLAAAQADLVNAQSTLTRISDLHRAHAVSQQDVDDAQAKFAGQQARVASLQASYELILHGPRQEEIAAAAAQVTQARGTLALANSDLINTTIRAPIAGTILARNVEVGEFVTTGFVGEGGAKGFVVSLANLHDLQVELDISQNDFAKVRRNQPCWITTDAYPDRRYDGNVELISPEANRQKATIQVKVQIHDPDSFLRPDMNATVAFRGTAPGSETAATLPSHASGGRVAAPHIAKSPEGNSKK